MLSLQLPKPGNKLLSPESRVLGKSLPAYYLYPRRGGGAGYRVSAEGSPVAAGVPVLGKLRLIGNCREGHTRGEGLGHCYNVGYDPVVFKGKNLSCPAEAGLNLVADEQNAVFFRYFPKLLQKSRWGGYVAPLSENRLYNKCRRLLGRGLRFQ